MQNFFYRIGLSRLGIILSLLIIFLPLQKIFPQNNSYSVFEINEEQGTWKKYRDNSEALYQHIASLAEDCFQKRMEDLSQLNDQHDLSKYTRRFNETFFGQIGQCDTPLNAMVTGTLERDSFSVEKIIFESQPGLFVSGILIIPKFGTTPHPAILVGIGHSQESFRKQNYQTSILNLVRNGFVVFTYDPIAQGERIQNFDNLNKQWKIKGSTHEHSYVGGQCLLAGYSVSDYFIIDGIRALDYLSSRPEVDASRIGMTGISGGGTQTAFLSAYDERIVASAPECYITSYCRLFETVGPQDAEQNPYRGIKQGFEQADLLISRAPKPTMIVSATEDFFSIQGARETFKEVQEIYQIAGLPDHIQMSEASGTHGFHKDNRESVCRFFRSQLNLPGVCKDKDVTCFDMEDLQVSPSGQVSSSYDSKTIFDINKERAIEIINSRPYKLPGDIIRNKDYYHGKICELSGYDSLRVIESVVFTGRIIKETYTIEKYFIRGSRFKYPIPFVFIRPNSDGKRPVLLYLESSGKESLLQCSDEIEQYISMGYSILAPDLIGTGELDYTKDEGDSFIRGVSYNIWFAANLVGTSIAGLQASDMRLILQYLDTRDDIESNNITALVKDELCTSYLHFSMFNRPLRQSILVNPLISFEDILMRKYYEPRYLWTAVPGAIVSYDIPQMLSLLAPHELAIINPVNSQGQTADSVLINQQLTVVKDVYELSHSPDKLDIISIGENYFIDKILGLMEIGK